MGRNANCQHCLGSLLTMLEILLVVGLSKMIAATVREKGRKPTGYVVLLVLLWIGGEIMGAIVGVVIAALHNPGALHQDFNIGTYVCALIGAACGAAIAFVVAHSVAPLRQWPASGHFGDDDYDDER